MQRFFLDQILWGPFYDRTDRAAFVFEQFFSFAYIQMFTEDILSKVPSMVFQNQSFCSKSYVKTVLKPEWLETVSKKTSLLELRDCLEELANNLLESFGCAEGQVVSQSVLKELKGSTDRVTKSLDFLESIVEKLFDKPLQKTPRKFVEHALNQKLLEYYSMCKLLVKYRPIFQVSRETVERVVQKMEALGSSITTNDLVEFQSELNVRSIMPVLALCQQSEDIDDLFINCPLPRVFGFPSCVRNSIEKAKEPQQLCKTVHKHALSLDRVVLAGHGHLTFLNQSKMRIIAAPRAHLIANLPGLSGYIWVLDPKTLQAAIYTIWPKFQLIIEFDLTKDEPEEPNWIDCQRDTEGNLVLLYGHINALTGSIQTQNMAAFDEDLLSGGTLEFLTDISEVPNRQAVGQRIDWRDHGNLLSAHHSVLDEMVKGDRVWTHSFDIVFANHLLFSIETQSRPIEALYGSPKEMFLFSPLSSKKLQHWTLQEDPKEGFVYKMESFKDLPKLVGDLYWQSLCVA